MSEFRTIHRYGRDETTINKSKFIGSAIPIQTEEEAIAYIDKIRKEFRDANHNVYAYTVGENGNIQRFSDDGEPSGTAGMPVLNVIKLEDLRNVLVVVTRYFGGIKLGAGGLVRAYTKGAKIGLESGTIVTKVIYYDVVAQIEYTMLGKIENELNKNKYIIKDKLFRDKVDVNVICREDDIENLKAIINEATSAKAHIMVGQASYYSISDGKIME